MKRCVLIIITCFYAVVSAQTTFTGPYTIFKPKVLRPDDVQAADIDGDGDLDVVGASYGDYSPVWFENTGGGTFSGVQPVGNECYYSHAICTGDLDGDGDIDVVAGSGDYGIICWFNNDEYQNVLGALDHDLLCWYENDGSGNFSRHTILPMDYNYIESLFIADLDGDTDLDLLVTSFYGDKLAWYENDGTGHFSAQNIINDPESAGTFAVSSVYAADIDGDGDKDVLTSRHDIKKTLWYENNGHGNFVSCNTVGEGIGGQKVIAADVDQDGDLDVFASADENIALSVNTGKGVFEKYTVINADMRHICNISTADMDNDGDPDLIITSYGLRIAWFENEAGVFSSKHDIISRTNTYVGGCSFPADLNNDGTADLLYTDKEYDEIGWCKNTGDGSFGHAVSLCSSVEITEICSADFDNDGDADIASASGKDNGIAWYRNNGIGCFSEPITVSRKNKTVDVRAVDMNLDGNMDIVYACRGDSAVGWFENTGYAGFTGPRLITDSTENATDVRTGDAEADGDIDVLWMSYWDKKLAWHTNDGFCVFTGQKIISADIDRIYDAQFADLDSDGDLDVLVGYGNTVAWHENIDDAFSSELKVIDSTYDNISVCAADLDGDNDLDVLHLSEGGVVWHRNEGAGNFSERIFLWYSGSDAFHGSVVFAADMDMDQDMDIVVGMYRSSRVAWYENLGGGEFSNEMIIAGGRSAGDITYYGGLSSVIAADIDGDGDKDIACSNSFDDTILWFKNMLIETGIDSQGSNPVPDGFGLTAYPNPFNQSVTISFTGTEQSSNASILIFDVSGKQVKKLKPEVQKSGTCTAVWDGTGQNNRSAPTGVYIIRLQTGGNVHTVKVSLVK